VKGTLEERFWAKVDKQGPDECWEWQGAKIPKGYGQIREGGHCNKSLLAHRVSYELAHGPIPAGKFVCHHCDNPSCVNPAHLWIGTNAENLHDMIDKGRGADRRGERAGGVKLIEQDVHEIRRMLSRAISQTVIAKKYGVAQVTISMIKTGKTWSWLKEA